MKLIGPVSYNSNETTTIKTLTEALLLNPEISFNVSNLFENNFSAFSSFLARKGYIKKGLFPDFNSPSFKVIGNRKFKWALKGYPFRKGKIVQTTESPAGYANIGQYKSEIYLYLNTRFFNPNNVLELADRRTLLWVENEYPVETSPGVFRYKCRLLHSDESAYVNPKLIEVGAEIGFGHTAFPEMSETGYEMNTFHEWHANTMTIQRMAYSISGSAKASKLAVSHNGSTLYTTEQEIEMLRRWAIAREHQLIHGRRTVDLNTDNVNLHDLKGREIVTGDGILNQGAESLKYQYNTMTIKMLEKVMENINLASDTNDDVEVLVLGGQAFVNNFQRLMRDVFKFNPIPLFTDANGMRGVDSTFNCYMFGGVKLIVALNKSFNAEWRPKRYDSMGVDYESHRGIFISLGRTVGGDANIELVALGNGEEDRSFIKKAISGMVGPGMSSSGRVEVTSNSMDGMQVQVLSETGVKVGNPYAIAELYKPII